MNQILITKKLYVTPELKRKKKVYKLNFILSIFLICVLMSFYIYAEYEKNKSEEASQELLAEITDILFNAEDEDSEDLLVVAINPLKQDNKVKIEPEKRTTSTGYTYSIIGVINIPDYNINYSIIEGEKKTTQEYDELLRMSPCKYKGPDLNEVGNVSILGHNYLNNKFFSKVPKMQVGDIVEITDLYGTTIKYAVYDKYSVQPSDLSGTDSRTNGKKEITLIACTDDGKQRVMLKCREVK